MTEQARPDWADIRRRYEDTADAVADICRDACISQRDIDTIRKKEKWRRKHPRPFPPPRSTPPASAPPPSRGRRPAGPEGESADAPSGVSLPPSWGGARGGGTIHTAALPDSAPPPLQDSTEPASTNAADGSSPIPSPAARRRLLERLVAAISMKLEQLERRIGSDLASGQDSSTTDHDRETRTIGALIDNLDKLRELEAGYANPTGKSGAGAATTDLADEAERCRRELAERLSRLVDAATPDA